ncbi:hypothetical protein SLA2020_503460 [Shorea laevis]
MIVADSLCDSSDNEVDDIRCENIAEKDVSDEETEAEDLERRMWKDRIKLKRMKERQKLAAQQAAEKQKPKQASDQQENDASTALMPVEKGPEVQSHLSASEYDHYHAIPSDNVISTQNMCVEERPMLCTSVQRAEQHDGAAYDFYNQSVEYGPGHHGHHTQMEINVPQINAGEDEVHVPTLGRNENDIIGGETDHFVKDMFHAEEDRAVDNPFGSPTNSLPFYGGFSSSPFNLGLDGTIDDFLLDESIIEYFGA